MKDWRFQQFLNVPIKKTDQKWEEISNWAWYLIQLILDNEWGEYFALDGQPTYLTDENAYEILKNGGKICILNDKEGKRLDIGINCYVSEFWEDDFVRMELLYADGTGISECRIELRQLTQLKTFGENTIEIKAADFFKLNQEMASEFVVMVRKIKKR